MSNCRNVQSTELIDLPVEILLNIFEHSTSDDRKAIKLVCKKLFDICNSAPIWIDEVLKCIGLYSLSDIYELLDKSPRQILNLRFYNVKFFDNGNAFWENNGCKIRSIELTDCDFQEGVVEKIIIFCENLSHLSLIYSDQYTHSKLNMLHLDLGRLLRNGVFRENLQSLTIAIVDSRLLSNCILYCLFSIFSKVRLLSISCNSIENVKTFQKITLDKDKLMSTNVLTFSPILNYLTVASYQIEKLKLSFPTNFFSINFVHRLFETLTAMTRLTELSMKMRSEPVRLNHVEMFFHSKRLKSLEFCIEMNCSLDQFLPLVLHSSSDLRLLKISFFRTLRMSNIFGQKILKSRLEKLSLPGFVPDSELNNLNNFSSKSSLRHLSFNYILDGFSFLLCFPNLRHLKMSVENISLSEILNFFITNQSKLKSLVLRDHHLTTIPDTEKPDESQSYENSYTLQRFTNLIHLELFTSSTDCVTKMQSFESALCKLKFLRVGFSTNSISNPLDLLALMDKMPFIEALRVCCGTTTFDVWLQICQKLDRLRYLNICDGNKEMEFSDSDYRKLFVICPSLRVVVHDSISGRILASYYLNTIKNAVYRKQESYKYLLCQPKIGKFKVKWINF